MISPEPQRPKSLILDNLPGLLGRLGDVSPSGSGGVVAGGAGAGSGRDVSPRQSPAQMSLVSDVEEIRVSPIVSKRGVLNVLEQRNKVRHVIQQKQPKCVRDLSSLRTCTSLRV